MRENALLPYWQRAMRIPKPSRRMQLRISLLAAKQLRNSSTELPELLPDVEPGHKTGMVQKRCFLGDKRPSLGEFGGGDGISAASTANIMTCVPPSVAKSTANWRWTWR